MNEMDDLKEQLIYTISELDHNRVSWIDKHLVIDLQEKAQVLLSTVVNLEEEQVDALEAAQTFLDEVEPILIKLNEEVA